MLPARKGLKLEALLLVCWIALCRHDGAARYVAPRVNAGVSYARLAVALGERDPDSLDYYYGPAEWVADIRKDPPALVQIRQSALALIGQLHGGEQREQFLVAQLRALVSRVNLLLGAPLSFDQETKAMFGVMVPPTYNQQRLARTRRELDRLLPGRGGLAQRYLSFDQKFVVPPQRLTVVMNRAMAGCRKQTVAYMSLPPGETITVEYVQNKPWSAFSRYQGNFRSLIQINTGLSLTVDQVLQLACHEGYPGHHTYNSVRELELVRRRHWPEAMVQPTFSPLSMASEAAATYAIELAFPERERTRFERDELFPLAGLDKGKAELYGRIERLVDELHPAVPAIARDYLDGRLEFVRAAAALESQVLMVHSEATLKYMNEYRSYVTAYTFGRDLMAEAVGEGEPALRWRNYVRVMESADF